VAEKLAKAPKLGIAPLSKQRHRHIKTGIPIGLRIVIPLAATIFIHGCSCAYTQLAKKEVKGMGNQELFVNQKAVSVDSLPPRKADTLQTVPIKTEGKEKRDALLKARIDELKKEWQKYIPDMSEKGKSTKPPFGGSWSATEREMAFNMYEHFLYSYALEGNTGKVAESKKDIERVGKQYGQEERARKIIENFDKINSMK